MLVNLYIDNIAVIEHSEIMFESGLNVLTGETGAGKSIIIDAIHAILGQRTSRELIRTGASSAMVSALFSMPCDEVKKSMEEFEIPAEADGSLLIQRSFSQEGKNVCRVNGRPVTASILKEIGRHLINIHGQHENQDLLSPQLHIHYIDSMGGLKEELEQYQASYRKAVSLKKKLIALHTDNAEKERRIDLLKYQIHELESADIHEGEQEDLLEQKSRFTHAEKIAGAVGMAKSAFLGEEGSQGILQMLGEISSSLQEVSNYLPQLNSLASRVRDLTYEAEDINEELRAFEESDYDPRELEVVESRLDELYRLGLKYGPGEEDMIKFLKNAKRELEDIEISDEQRQALEEEYQTAALKAKEQAEALSEKRRTVARRFVQGVKQELVFLDMPHVELVVAQELCKLNSTGCDELQFLISTNPGEPPKPIAKIASGGELSRIMLAIKNILADKDQVDTLIFDEVDTGISGRAAQKVGQKLKETARNRQILCVTHLAQIAAHADHHLLIEKHVSNGKTFTNVKILDFEERKQELARIMSGTEPTPLQLQGAEELLKKARSDT